MSAAAWMAVSLVGAAGLVGCAYLMYRDRRGIPALKALDSHFDCPDMRLRYTPGELWRCFDGVGDEGRGLLRRFWTIDFGFILSLLLVMLAIAHNTATIKAVRLAMYGVSGLRAVADGVENGLLMWICKGYPAKKPEGLARVASGVTMVKWGLMGLWVVGLFLGLVVQAAKL